jgi:hypothetical protein
MAKVQTTDKDSKLEASHVLIYDLPLPCRLEGWYLPT